MPHTLTSWVEASVVMDRQKSSWQGSIKQLQLQGEHDPALGGLVYFLSPTGLFERPKFHFSPFAWVQYCQKVIQFPHKALDTRLLSADLIMRIGAERRDRIQDRTSKVLLRQVTEGRKYIRGIVRPTYEPMPTTDLLRALEEAGEPLDAVTLDPPTLGDHQVSIYLIFDEEIEGVDLRYGLLVVTSEVGTVKGNLRVESFVYDPTLRERFILRPRGTPLLRGVDEGLSPRDLVEEAFEAFRESRASLATICEAASNTNDEVSEKLPEYVAHGLPFDPGTRRRIQAQVAHRLSLTDEHISARLVASSIAELAKEELRPARRLHMELTAGQVLMGIGML